MTTAFFQTQPSSSSAAAAAAPQAPQAGSADDRAETFQAVQGGETYTGSTLLVEAYAAIWLLLFIWIFLLWRKQATLGERLDGLEKALDRAAAKATKKSE